MLKCSLWFRVVDDCFSVVLWETWVCLCLFVFLMFLDLAGVDVCIGGVERAHNAALDTARYNTAYYGQYDNTTLVQNPSQIQPRAVR